MYPNMYKAVLYLMVIMIAAALVIAPSTAAIYSPNKVSNFQISSQKLLSSNFNTNNPSSFSLSLSPAIGTDYGPAPIPNLVLPAYIGTGVSYQNLFIPGACPGGCCGCCC